MLPTLLKLLRRTTYAALTILLILFAIVQFNQHLLRHRAEALHADILALQLHPGTFTDLQRLQTKWGVHSHGNGTCTPAHCILQIKLVEPFLKLIGNHEPWRPVWRSYMVLGGRLAIVTGEVRVHDNRIWGADYDLHLEVPGRGVFFSDPQTFEENGYTLIADLQSGPHIGADYYSGRTTFLRRGYFVGGPNCGGCLITKVHMTSSLDPSLIEKLSTVDFSCFTRLRPCGTLEELIPGASAQRNADNKIVATEQVQPTVDDCSGSTTALAREADNLVLATVTQLRSNLTYPDHPFHVADVQVDESMKSSTAAPAAFRGSIPATGYGFSSPNVAAALKPGDKLLILYSNRARKEGSEGIEVFPRSILPATPTNLSDVRTGIAQDSSAGERYEHYSNDWSTK